VIRLPEPYAKVVVLYDDPDRTDVDWLRSVGPEAAENLRSARRKPTRSSARLASPEYLQRWFSAEAADKLAAASKRRNAAIESEPLHKLAAIGGREYVLRLDSLRIGHKLKFGKFKPKVVVTTTEWLTGYFALTTLRASGLRIAQELNLFHTEACFVTAISTTITRSKNHAALLPIIEKLKMEFPERRPILIADGLGCDLTLSSNKGRNDLAERDTIIKLSWPHPQAIATAAAHFDSTENRDLFVACLLADLANQALGRNQGFRFRGYQAILLIDPKYYGAILGNNLLRYKLTPWSSKLPPINARTPKRSLGISYAREQSPLERRLLELIGNFEQFGHSEEAKRLAVKLTDRQRAKFMEWIEGTKDFAEKVDHRKLKAAEAVRRHRAKKELAAAQASRIASQPINASTPKTT
jgi:hypothetical protein